MPTPQRATASRPPTPITAGYVRKRLRTRGQLVEAAKRVMARKGVEAATIVEIAAEAGVAAGTFYNYFATREQVLESVAIDLVEEFREVMAAIRRTVDDPAEQLAISVRLFLARVREDSLWGWFMARFGPTLPILRDQTREIIRKGILAEGMRRKRFHLESTRAVGDLITGATVTSLRSILEGRASPDIGDDVAELILRALGVSIEEARAIARRAIPRLESRHQRKSAAADQAGKRFR